MKKMLFCVHLSLTGLMYADSILFLPDPYRHKNNTMQSYDDNPIESPNTAKPKDSPSQNNQTNNNATPQKNPTKLQEFQELEEFKDLEEFHNLPKKSNEAQPTPTPQIQQTITIPNDLT